MAKTESRKSELDEIVKILYESGVLKKIPRSGWLLAGIENPETVAEHTFRTTLIGYFLATLERVDEEKVIKMCLLHDLSEVRVGERNKVNARYVDSKNAERKAFHDIFKNINGKEFVNLFDELEQKKTKEAVVARDADLLEVFIQAKEYLDSGKSKFVSNWMKNAGNALKTKSARKLASIIRKMNSSVWWLGLKKIDVYS